MTRLNCMMFMVALLALFAAAPASYAMRCGSDIVGEGSTKLEVLNACGEPMQKFGEDLKIGDTGINREGDEKWVYDIGGGVYHVVYFDGFQVRKIEIEQK